MTKHPLDELLRVNRLPHIWCPGCGNGTILGALLRALKRLADRGLIDLDKTVVVSGIGCTGRAASYVNLDTAHTPHGRAIPFATGVKLANPKLEVIVFSGDGDLAGIGCGHLVHAARRNMDLTVIMVNNMVYALTGGQVAPTTLLNVYTTTTPRGNPEPPLDVARLVALLGVNYAARWSIHYPHKLVDIIYDAIAKRRGFRFVEVVSLCPEIYGRHIGCRSPVELYELLKRIVKPRGRVSPYEARYDNTEITLGVFADNDYPGYLERIGLKTNEDH